VPIVLRRIAAELLTVILVERLTLALLPPYSGFRSILRNQVHELMNANRFSFGKPAILTISGHRGCVHVDLVSELFCALEFALAVHRAIHDDPCQFMVDRVPGDRFKATSALFLFTGCRRCQAGCQNGRCNCIP
jgi:hypothetical protein